MNWIKRLFKRKEPQELDALPQPLFEPGELVIIYDPYVLDGMDAHEVREPRFETVKRSAFVPNLGVFAYELEGKTEWYNEAWLQPAIYGTETINLHFDKPVSKRDQIDKLLDEYNDMKALEKMFGGGEYRDRLKEIEKEIASI